MKKVKANAKWGNLIDGATGKRRRLGEMWEVDDLRAEHLLKHGVVEIVEEMQDKRIVKVEDERPVELPKPKKTTKKAKK